MNKFEEIKAFETLVSNLPADGYIRPWLESQADEITNAIRQDYLPEVCAMSLTEFRQHREGLLHDTEHQARIILTKAERDAGHTIQQADTKADDIIGRLNDALHTCREAINY